jgi:hypothetical protein
MATRAPVTDAVESAVTSRRRFTRFSLRTLFAAIALLAVTISALIALLSEDCLDVDIHSGSLWHGRKLGNLVLSANVAETRFSRFVGEHLPSRQPEWRVVSSHGILSPISPHYRYHGTAHDLDDFMTVCDMWRVPENIQRESAKCILLLLDAGNPLDVSGITDALK